MKRASKIIGVIILVIFVALSSLAVWQRDKIKSLYIAYKYSPEQLSQKMDNSQDSMQKNIESFTGIVFRPVTDEEQRQIDAGETTKAKIFEKILNETIEDYLKKSGYENIIPSNGTSKASPYESLGEKSSYDILVAEYVSKLYALKGTYTGKLEALLGQASAEYYALPNEKRTKTTYSTMISKYISIAAGYESACDSEVNILLADLEDKIKAIGADTSVVSSIRETYYEEKSLQSAYYMSQLK